MDSTRDDKMKSIRPDIPVDAGDSHPVEAFQHEVLRPILKLLNPTILDLVASTLERYGTGFSAMDPAAQVQRLENLLGQDRRLKRTLLGMVIGHFTSVEMQFYLQHTAEVRRRMVELATERVRSQVGEIVERMAGEK